MKKIFLASLVLSLSACGAHQPAPPAPAAPAQPAVQETPAPPAPAAVTPWSDVETLEKGMHANGDAMKKIKGAVESGKLGELAEPAATIAKYFEELSITAKGFTGPTPEKFVALTDSALIAAREFSAATAAPTPESSDALKAKLATLGASCKACHDIYKK